jgi:PKD repeat protein
MEGNAPEILEIGQTFTTTTEISPFNKNHPKIYGLSVSATVQLPEENSVVRIILIDQNFDEHLVYEVYPLISSSSTVTIDDLCEETAVLDGIKAQALRFEITNATVMLDHFTYAAKAPQSTDIKKIKKEKKQAQNEDKIKKINQNLAQKGQHWVAGKTSVSELSYAEKKKLYGNSNFPPGFEYYSGGIISTSADEVSLKSATEESPYVKSWDWRNRHGKNWVTPITDQGLCGSCWAFAAAGATEAMVNVYYNQLLNLDLSEQDLISCSGAGDCAGGYSGMALDYITSSGIVDEGTFPYSATNQTCENKSTSPSEIIKISGRVIFGSSSYPKTEDVLKQMLIEYGPLSGALYDWSHAMVLVGYKVVQEGDVFFYRDLNLNRYWISIEAGDPLIGKTVWIFKNSWGPEFGDEGYVFVETPITNIGSTYGLKLPVTSWIQNYDVVCEDRDGDGYFWWGLGEKPATCNGPDQPDGDDSDPRFGPLDGYGNCILLDATPVADFTENKAVINIGESVSFSDLTSSNPTSWNWIFEGGSPVSSAEKNPTTQYNTPGTYDVWLMVSNINGTDTLIRENMITVENNITADFTADKLSVNIGESVTFSDQSTGAMLSWNWIFEGGTPSTSNEKSPAIQYNNPGNYGVSLVVSNAYGSDTIIRANFISVDEFIVDYCTSSGSASEEWIAGVQIGGESFQSGSSGQSGYEYFTGSTTFNLESGGAENFVLTPGFVNRANKEYWRIWIDLNGDRDFDDAGELLFTSTFSKGDVSGTLFIPEVPDITTRLRISMKRNVVPGVCEVFDLGEVEDYTIQISKPADQPPVANFSADATSVSPGATVQFSDLSTNSPGQWNWSFPGGTPSFSTEQNPVVSYSLPGKYDVILTVTKDNFEPSVMEKTAYIAVTEEVLSEYCLPMLVNSTADWITNFNINGALESSSMAESFSLSNNIISLIPGQNYIVSMSPWNSDNRNYWKLWIDFNNDGDFNDTGENLLAAKNKRGAFVTSIDIPDSADGIRRMRLSMRTGSDVEACDDNFDGEVEDYLASFSPNSSAILAASNSNTVWYNNYTVKVYPNPVKDKLNIHFGSYTDGDTYSLFDLSGKRLVASSINNSNAEIYLETFLPGVYVIEVVQSNSVFREKIIKQ